MKRNGRRSKLNIFLIKPSKYDDDGFVVRHWRGVLPSNTLACLDGLTEDVRRRKLLGDVDLRIHVLDEMVAIGDGTKDSSPKPGQLALSEVVIENSF